MNIRAKKHVREILQLKLIYSIREEVDALTKQRKGKTCEGLCGIVKAFEALSGVLPLNVCSLEDLKRRLTKVVDNANCSEALNGVFDVIKVFCPMVREVMEYIGCFDGSLASLFEPKDEVDPTM